MSAHNLPPEYTSTLKQMLIAPTAAGIINAGKALSQKGSRVGMPVGDKVVGAAVGGKVVGAAVGGKVVGDAVGGKVVGDAVGDAVVGA